MFDKGMYRDWCSGICNGAAIRPTSVEIQSIPTTSVDTNPVERMIRRTNSNPHPKNLTKPSTGKVFSMSKLVAGPGHHHHWVGIGRPDHRLDTGTARPE